MLQTRNKNCILSYEDLALSLLKHYYALMFYSTCWNFDNKFLEKFILIDCSSYRSVIGIDLHVIWWSPIRFSSLISKFISSFSSCREYLHKNQKKATFFLDSILTQKTQRKKKQLWNGLMEWINWTVKRKHETYRR